VIEAMRDRRIRHWYPLTFGLICSLLVIALVGPGQTARASVTLLYFTASPLASSIDVRWETATELNTNGFNVYRSDAENPASWGSPVFTTASRSLDGTTGAQYAYEDGNVQPNVRYYYLLEELSSSGNTRFLDRIASAGVGLATSTATISPTPSRTGTPIIVGTATRTRTPTPPPIPTEVPAPTATRQFANTATPIPTPTPTPFLGSAFNSALPTPFRIPTATPLTSFQLTSPTPMGGIPLQQAPAFEPLATLTPTPAFVAFAPSATPTFLTAQLEPSASPTALLRAQQNITRTPQVFEPNAANRRATPAATTAARSSRLAFTLGGGAVLLAVLLGIGGFAFWKRRH
jgi:hypothetical protein